MCYSLLTLLVLCSTLSTAAEPVVLTDEHLARLTIRAVEGKPGLFVIPGFGGAAPAVILPC
jgi:hypothetical protein